MNFKINNLFILFTLFLSISVNSLAQLNYNFQQKKSNILNIDSFQLNSYEYNGKNFKIAFFDPKYIKLKVQYSDKSSESFKDLSKQKNFVMAVNGVTVSGDKPQGDLKGENLDYINNPIKIYQLIGDQTAVNLRHSLAITENNEVNIVKGGIKTKSGPNRSSNSFNHDKYKYFINGAALLFDGHNFLNEKSFLNYFIMNNDKDLIKNMIPESNSPRTVLGITTDNKIVLGSFSEGKYGDGIGFTGFEVYQVLKSFGATKALMFDGGSASAMFTKKQGFVSVPKNEYHYNSSFISVFE